MAVFIKKLLSHPLIDTLIHAKGNERACLWMEPLWGIPYNLYLPFVSVYMVALGMEPLMIGLNATISLISQMIWALLSGPLTDKLGRRRCTFIFDILSWSVPALLWMSAQNEYWFYLASAFNGMYRITENSWTLLFVEDSPDDKLVNLYSLTSIAGLLAGFIVPLSFLFVEKYSVVPTMRFLYGLTFVMMTAKFILLYHKTQETTIGQRRMEEYRLHSMKDHLLGSLQVLLTMLKNRRIMLTVALLACYGATRSVYDNFWPIFVTDKMGIEEKYLSLFSTIRSIVLMASYFVIVPRLNVRRFMKPVTSAFAALAFILIPLLLLKSGNAVLLSLGVFIEALSYSVLMPLVSSLQMLNVSREERARMNGLLISMCLLITSPVGLAAGALSEIDRALPFVLIIAFCGLSMYLALKIWHDNAAVKQMQSSDHTAVM